jgi:hypothetical protein
MTTNALQGCSLLELAVELLEDGKAAIIPSLHDHEPIEIEMLLSECSRRVGAEFDSIENALAAISESPLLPEDQRIPLLHAIRVRRARQKFFDKKRREQMPD